MNIKNLKYIIPAVLLMVIAGILYYRQATTKLSFKESQLFEFDSSKVELIHFDFGDQSITLSKMNSKWLINGLYNLDPLKFKAVYQAHKRLSFKSPATEQISRQLNDIPDNQKIKVQMTVAGKKREYVMVYDSLNQTGTYVTIPGREDTYYQIFLPGYPRDDLRYLYPENIGFWRNRTLLALEPHEIESVAVTYPSRPDASFKLTLKNGTRIIHHENGTTTDQMNTESVHQYLAYFADVKFKQVVDTLYANEVTNITTAVPEAIITLQVSEGKTKKMQVFNKMLESEQATIDPHHFYVQHSDFEKIILVNFIELAPLLKEFDYFL